MDPDACIAEQRRLALRIIDAFDRETPVSPHEAARLADLVVALDEWISHGGFPPEAWAAWAIASRR